jgi:FKBP-type peptidyl-prolyl cis-trans isomerase
MLKRNTLIFLLVAMAAASCLETDGPTVDNQLIKEIDEIDAYLKANVTDFVAYDQSGIRIVIHEFGQNPPARQGQTIKATYTGKLFSDGSTFETGNLNTKVESITGEGLRYSITALLAGSRASFYVPSKYAFGAAGTTGVPPNSTIVYESVTLTEVIRTSAEQTQFTLDTAAIHDFIIDNGIQNAIEHSSGMWYTIDQGGTGTFATVYNNVSFNYTGTLLSNGSEFDKGQLTNQGIFGLIDGFKVGLPLMREGAKFTFYIPSGLGYGTSGAGSSIPANANLKFEVTLIDVL